MSISAIVGWKGYAIAAGLSAVLSAIAAWTVQDWRYTSQIKSIETEHAETVTQQLIYGLAKSEEYRQLERDLATALTKVSGYYQEKITNVEKDKTRFIAGVRNGTIKLRDPYQATGSVGGITAAALGATGGLNATAGCELSGEASEFLYSEAARADKIVEQLTACQEAIWKYVRFLEKDHN
ncbi:Bacteriophage Rz lysis protein [Methylobacillus rhizosphaerae]|uniref:Bacteriophage Rz lysis protein n=1 Tax=Methylobacillus rhizosphaerae TaxID=551994 RepID=A0A238YSH2_9PROT|nr:lysis system i-spanin subunit Rz [Methylobacillus rhizosphaerae]SNR73912.1 Bacteriophage Rz lysis protein [Methylobacillus rhizosphaerae]